MRQSNIFIGLFSVFILSGCASVTGSNSQAITVTAICDSSRVVRGAFCTLINDKGQWFVETPGSVLVQKAFGDLTISCKHENTHGTLVLTSSSNANAWGNILAGGVIGIAVDASTGAGFNYPPMVTVNMQGTCSQEKK
jgi:hypothetical protein